MTAEELEQLGPGDYVVTVASANLKSYYTYSIGDEFMFLYKTGGVFIFSRVLSSKNKSGILHITSRSGHHIETRSKLRDDKLGSLGI